MLCCSVGDSMMNQQKLLPRISPLMLPSLLYFYTSVSYLGTAIHHLPIFPFPFSPFSRSHAYFCSTAIQVVDASTPKRGTASESQPICTLRQLFCRRLPLRVPPRANAAHVNMARFRCIAERLPRPSTPGYGISHDRYSHVPPGRASSLLEAVYTMYLFRYTYALLPRQSLKCSGNMARQDLQKLLAMPMLGKSGPNCFLSTR